MQTQPSTLSGTFVGRERELRLLRARLDGTIAGSGGVALLAGEPGIGKTRLAEELAEAARARGVRVAWGRCWEGEGAPAFWPWLNVLRACLAAREPERLWTHHGVDSGLLAELLPELREQFPDLPQPPVLEPPEARFRLFESVAHALKALAEDEPLVLILDDLHWADPASLLLLQFLVQQQGLGRARLLVVGAYRDTELDRGHPLSGVLAELRRERDVEWLSLQGLDSAEVHAWIDRLPRLATGEVGLDLAEAIAQETEGNPFFVQELVRHVQEVGRVNDADGGGASSRTTDAISISGFALTEGTRGALGRRLARISETTRQMLSEAAALGPEFNCQVLRTAAELADEAFAGALEEAIEAHILGERNAGGQPAYAFRHALIRQALLEKLSIPRKQRLHLRAAAAIETLYARNLDPHVASLATHYRLAGATADPEKAIGFAIRAGEQAQTVFAWEEAVSQWQVALRLLEEAGAEPERRADLLVCLADLVFATERGSRRGPEYLEAALALYATLGLARQAAEVQVRLGRFAVTVAGTEDLPRAIALFRAARPALEATPGPEPDSVVLSYLYVGLVQATFRAFQPEPDGPQLLAWAVAVGERLGEVDLQGQALAMAWCYPMLAGRLAVARAVLDRAWELDWSRGRLITSFLIMSHLHLNSTWLLDPRASLGWLERWLDQPAAAQAISQRAHFLKDVVVSRWLLGELEAARRASSAGESGGSAAGYHLALGQGDWAQAGAVAETQGEAFRLRGDHFNESNWLASRAAAARLEGDAAVAEAGWRAALALWAPLAPESSHLFEVHFRPPLALLLTETGRPAEARSQVVRCRAIIANGEDWRGLLGTVERAEAATLAAEGNLREAEPHFERALTIFEQYGLVWEEAETHLVWGRFLLERHAREQERAREHFDAAIAIYRRIGAGEPWVERVERLRQEALGPQPSVVSRRWDRDGLTPREVEVLRLLATGMSNREIGEALVLSVRTVERHIADVYRQIGVSGRAARAAATAYALTRRLPAPLR